jgi:hypothetical protein
MYSNEKLVTELRKTLHPDYIKEATQYLDSVKSCQGFAMTLLIIGSSEEIELQVKMSAFIYLKNIV